MSTQQKMLLTRTRIHQFGASDESFMVTVMAVADGYAMVRRKGCMPFVCREKELTPLPEKVDGQT